MADIFDKCTRFLKKSAIVRNGRDRAIAESVLFRKSPLDNAGPWIEVEGRRILQFSTNDYLGLANDPRVRAAAVKIAERYGVGAPMGARPLTGNTELHHELERQVAEFKRTEDALAFSSGAYTMMGVVACLAGPKDLILLDKFAHASLVCGARSSGAAVDSFAHNDVEDLEAKLAKTPSEQAVMVIVDGVYSMQGDMAPLPDLCAVCRKYGARLVVDDAHGTGVCGPTGRGTAEHFGVEECIDLQLGTFSKAFGTMGGFASGAADVIRFLRFNAPTILFTKAMPAVFAAATLEALRIAAAEPERRERLWRNARMLQDGLRRAGFDIGSTQAPITPVLNHGTDAVYYSKVLFDEFGIWASAVLFPAVPIGTSILRLIPTANHSRKDIQRFLEAIRQLKGRDWNQAGAHAEES